MRGYKVINCWNASRRIRNVLEQGDALLLLLLNFSLEYVTRRIQKVRTVELEGAHQFQDYNDDVSLPVCHKTTKPCYTTVRRFI
jgi:hypothetical protein